MDIKTVFQNLINSLSKKQITELYEKLGIYIEEEDTLPKLEETLRELRFSDGLVCPHCGKSSVVCNGSSRGKKRYRCKQCGKSFGMTTKTVFADSKLSLSTWLKYADCMSKGLTLRKTAQEVGISLKASFFMRHKLLSALSKELGVDTLSGTIEMDETYFAESFKGNHKKQCKGWIAPRKSGKSRKRGKEVEFRGISHQQVCVSVGMYREQHLVIMPVGTGN